MDDPITSTNVLLSVITAVKDDEHGLRRSATSLQAQTDLEFEWIIIDGASANISVLHEMQKLASVIVSEPDNGVYDAMNKGVALARGEFVYFLNAGDELAHPRALAKLMKATTSADVVFGDLFAFRKDRCWYRFRYPTVGYPSLLHVQTICHQALITRIHLLDRLGGFDPSFPIAADLKFLLTAKGVHARFRHVDTFVCRYAGGGISERQTPRLLLEKAKLEEMYPPTLRDRLIAEVFRRRRKYAKKALKHFGLELRGVWVPM